MTSPPSAPVLGGVESRKLLIAIFYRSHWDSLSGRLWGIDPRTNEIVKQVRDRSLRGRLASWADKRDIAWRNRYAQKGTLPSDKWKRKAIPLDEENPFEEEFSS